MLIKTITRETPLGNPLLTKWLSGFGQINHLPYLIFTTQPHIQLYCPPLNFLTNTFSDGIGNPYGMFNGFGGIFFVFKCTNILRWAPLCSIGDFKVSKRNSYNIVIRISLGRIVIDQIIQISQSVILYIYSLKTYGWHLTNLWKGSFRNSSNVLYVTSLSHADGMGRRGLKRPY